MSAEWNLFVAAAIVQAQGGVFYERSLSKHPGKEEDEEHDRILINTLRPELNLVYDEMADESLLSPDSFARHYYSQILSRSKNLMNRKPDSYAQFSRMPKPPNWLRDWVH